jgi:hypothetical protein
MPMRFIKTRLVLLLAMLAGMSLAPSGVHASPSTQVIINPTPAQVPLCQALQVSVDVVDVTDLYGFDISVSFDPDVISVVDATLGPFLDAGFTVINSINNVAGTVRFVMTQLNPSVAKSGTGSLIYLQLRGKQNGATSPLTMTRADLAKRDGTVLTATLVSGTAQVTPGNPVTMPALSGVVTDTVTGLPVAGATVTLTDSLSLPYTTTVAANGTYTLACTLGQAITAGSGTATASAPAHSAAAGYSPLVTINPGANSKNIPLTSRAKVIYPLYFQVDGVSGLEVGLGWATRQETGTIGFNLYRADRQDPSRAVFIHFEPSRAAIIRSAASRSPGGNLEAVYRYSDTLPYSGVWWYWLVEVGDTGAQSFPGPVSATAITFSHFLWLPLVLSTPTLR